MIFNQCLSKSVVLLIGLYFLAACDGDADKFRQAVIAGDLKIQDLVVTPGERILNVGDKAEQYKASAKLENGSSIDLTSSVSWRISPPFIATVDAAGLLTAKQDGESTVIAQFAEHEGRAPLIVSTANLVKIFIQGPTQTDECRSEQFKANGEYDDKYPIRSDIDVVWSVSSEDIATISNEGLLITTKTGTVDVIATKDGVAEPRTVTVNSNLLAIAVTPKAVSLAKNDTQQITATGTYGDGSKKDITAAANWSSDNAEIASVEPNGLVKGVAKGSATITGACGGTDGEVVPDDKTTVTVSEATNGDALRINDGKPLVLKEDENSDEKLQLTLWIIRSDGSSEDVTKEADWTLADSDNSPIVLSNDGDRKGKIIDILSTGDTLVKAEYKEQSEYLAVTIEQKDSS